MKKIAIAMCFFMLAGPAVPPAVPVSKDKVKNLVILLQQLEIQYNNVQKQYNERKAKLGEDFQKATAEVLTEMKVDPKTHSFTVGEDGDLVLTPPLVDAKPELKPSK